MLNVSTAFALDPALGGGTRLQDVVQVRLLRVDGEMQFGHPGYALSLEPVPRDNCRKVPVVNVDVITSSQDGSARAQLAGESAQEPVSDLDLDRHGKRLGVVSVRNGGWMNGADRYG